MELYEAIHGRRDIEAFGEACPPRQTVEPLIEAATWAPNHHHTEPWRFHVLAGAGREEMAEAVGAWLVEQGAGEGPPRSARSKLMRSPVVIAVVQHGSPDDPERDREDYAACYCAIQNLLLAAHAEGLVAHLSTGALTTYEGARAFLEVGAADRIVAYINLGSGRADAEPKAGVREPAVVGWHWPD